jgi:hypothetical protein
MRYDEYEDVAIAAAIYRERARELATRTASYDDRQLAGVEISWTCCRRTVYATHPERGCLQCRK